MSISPRALGMSKRELGRMSTWFGVISHIRRGWIAAHGSIWRMVCC